MVCKCVDTFSFRVHTIEMNRGLQEVTVIRLQRMKVSTNGCFNLTGKRVIHG